MYYIGISQGLGIILPQEPLGITPFYNLIGVETLQKQTCFIDYKVNYS